MAYSTGWSYDSNNNDRRLIGITNSGITRSYSLSYQLHGGGNNPYDILRINDIAAPGHPFSSQAHPYSYDLSDRLLSANGASALSATNFDYSYDFLDNLTTIINGRDVIHATYNDLNEINTWGGDNYFYDANGNTLSGDGTRSYKWDAENRLVEIDYAGSNAKTQFAYDGLGRRVIDAETSPQGGTSTARNLWCGSNLCQTRDGGDNVLRRDMDEGELGVLTGQKLIYMPDHLGSVRDVLDGTAGTLLSVYDYSPYGVITRTYGSTPTDYRYAGLFYHPASTLNLASYRALDGVTGRFINRDPIREGGGINLFAYVGASPVNGIDTLGLENCMGGGYCDPFPPSTPPTWSDVANTIDILMWLPIGPGPELK